MIRVSDFVALSAWRADPAVDLRGRWASAVAPGKAVARIAGARRAVTVRVADLAKPTRFAANALDNFPLRVAGSAGAAPVTVKSVLGITNARVRVGRVPNFVALSAGDADAVDDLRRGVARLAGAGAGPFPIKVFLADAGGLIGPTRLVQPTRHAVDAVDDLRRSGTGLALVVDIVEAVFGVAHARVGRLACAPHLVRTALLTDTVVDARIVLAGHAWSILRFGRESVGLTHADRGVTPVSFLVGTTRRAYAVDDAIAIVAGGAGTRVRVMGEAGLAGTFPVVSSVSLLVVAARDADAVHNLVAVITGSAGTGRCVLMVKTRLAGTGPVAAPVSLLIVTAGYADAIHNLAVIIACAAGAAGSVLVVETRLAGTSRVVVSVSLLIVAACDTDAVHNLIIVIASGAGTGG